MREKIIIKLTAIFRDVFEDETIVITEELTANDVDKWDSINNVIMVTEVERTFNIKFQLVQLMPLQNAGDLIEAIEQLSTSN